MQATDKVKYFKIYRWDPDVAGQKPYLATYAINLDEYVPAAHVYHSLATAC